MLLLLVTIYTVTHIALQTNKNNVAFPLPQLWFIGIFTQSLTSWFGYDMSSLSKSIPFVPGLTLNRDLFYLFIYLSIFLSGAHGQIWNSPLGSPLSYGFALHQSAIPMTSTMRCFLQDFYGSKQGN